MTYTRDTTLWQTLHDPEVKAAVWKGVRDGIVLGLLIACLLFFTSCSAATGVGGLFGPSQMITQDGTGCVIPSVPSGAVVPPNPAPFPMAYKMQHMCEGTNCGDFLMPVYATTPAPACTMHIVTASGGPTAGGIGQWLLAVAAGIFAMVK